MNRIAVTAVASAAVLGTVGGTYAATSGVFESDHGDDRPAAHSSSSGSPSADESESGKPKKSTEPTSTPSETDEPTTNDGELLYMEGGTIHDGDTEVSVSGFRIGDVQDLQRVSGGWLVVERTGSQDAEFNATFVDSSGKTTRVGTMLGTWDVNDDGDSIVALWESAPAAETNDLEDPLGYQIRDARSGKVVNELNPKRPGYASASAGFVEDDVVIRWDTDEHPQLLQWASYGAGGFTLIAEDLISPNTGPTGDRMTAQTLGAPNSDDVGCLTGGTTTGDDWWTQCKFNGYSAQGPKFSPDGTRLLAVPARTDGFGPGAFAILDADTGKKVQGFSAPEFTKDAVWADDDSVFVDGYKDADFNGGVIYRCNLSGKCEVEVESDDNMFVGH
ncbi:hypothetical protein ASG90_00395 [Nocardioides sp. Soil797]|nr:hypothetical protein ASG90_00395 [Nocardioides sp. Soil797]